LNALRLVDGFEIETFAQRTGHEWDEIAPRVTNLVSRELLRVQGTRLVTTLVGLRFLNELLLSFLPETPQTTALLDCQPRFAVTLPSAGGLYTQAK
jgi:coproporphyrinogen III oxidase-like Fe-S oxidoreductase